jgi:hypothetical protein
MVRHNVRMVVAFGVITVLVAWVAFMVSFWLPDPAGAALQATALAMGIPGLVAAVVGVVFEGDLVNEFERRADEVKKPQPLRCTDCGSKILNTAGATIGDDIEGELMAGQWTPPEDASPRDR